jgi:hypothetical protein
LGPLAVVTLGGFGLYTMTGDAVAQARDPLSKDQHDTFQLVLTSLMLVKLVEAKALTGSY